MSNVFPIPRPPTPPAWCGHPGHPDWCDCGCGPPCPPSTVDAWREMARFKDMLRSIIDEMGITAKPMQGVIDGSDAKPGEVGEFIHGSAQLNYGASPAVVDGNVAPLVVPPGDWDLFGIVTISSGVGVISVTLAPAPAGISDLIWTQEGVIGVQTPTTGQMTMNTIRGNFTVPTLLSFKVHVDQSLATGLTAGVANVIVSGRRVR